MRPHDCIFCKRSEEEKLRKKVAPAKRQPVKVSFSSRGRKKNSRPYVPPVQRRNTACKSKQLYFLHYRKVICMGSNCCVLFLKCTAISFLLLLRNNQFWFMAS